MYLRGIADMARGGLRRGAPVFSGTGAVFIHQKQLYAVILPASSSARDVSHRIWHGQPDAASFCIAGVVLGIYTEWVMSYSCVYNMPFYTCSEH